MPWTLVQSNQSSVNSPASTAGSVSYPSPPTAGNLLVAYLNSDITQTMASAGWTPGPASLDGNDTQTFWKVAGAGEPSAVNFTAGGTGSPTQFGVFEYSGNGASPFGSQNAATATGATGNTSSPSVAPSPAPSADGELILAFALNHTSAVSASTSGTPSWTNGFTNIQIQHTGGAGTLFVSSFVASLVQTTAAAVSTVCTWTGGQNDRQALILAFKAGVLQDEGSKNASALVQMATAGGM